MVGDSLENDISPANTLGIASFWISDTEDPLIDEISTPTEAGDFKQLQEWLYLRNNDFEPEFNNPPALLAILRSTPAALSILCRELRPSAWIKRPQPAEWCQTEILCHLRDVELEVNLPRLRQLLQDSNPFIPGMDTDPWADERGYIQQDGSLALQGFITSRIQTLNLLATLSPEDWESQARHAIFGPTNLIELVSIMAGHDQLHIRQLFQLIHNLS
jgi:hypothetical protein